MRGRTIVDPPQLDFSRTSMRGIGSWQLSFRKRDHSCFFSQLRPLLSLSSCGQLFSEEDLLALRCQERARSRERSIARRLQSCREQRQAVSSCMRRGALLCAAWQRFAPWRSPAEIGFARAELATRKFAETTVYIIKILQKKANELLLSESLR